MEAFRWYACVQQSNHSWSCTETIVQDVLEASLLFELRGEHVRLHSVPRHIPQSFDSLLLAIDLKSPVKVVK